VRRLIGQEPAQVGGANLNQRADPLTSQELDAARTSRSYALHVCSAKRRSTRQKIMKSDRALRIGASAFGQAPELCGSIHEKSPAYRSAKESPRSRGLSISATGYRGAPVAPNLHSKPWIMALDSRLRRRALGVCIAALAAGMLAGAVSARAGTRYVDGISDQSLPAWDGSFSDSSFASFFRARWLRQISLARYVLQWNAMGEASRGQSAHGDYRERFEAWLGDVRSLGLAPVVALSSYARAYPGTADEYEQALEAVLDDAARAGAPIGYVEAWNEPNNQGSESPVKAGEIANWANSVCERRGCRVIAGDFEDVPSAVAYEQAYVSALDFAPGIWGIHPYYSVQAHSDATVLEIENALPDAGKGAQVWLTEIGAYYCADGRLRGEAQQASDASYLVNSLIPAVAPTHVFYYGFMAGDRAQLSCAEPGDFDSELYSASHAARSAAGILFADVPQPSLVFSPMLSSELLALAPSGG
jgi:hypothetical protein